MKLTKRNVRIAITAAAISGLVAFLGNACSGFNGGSGGSSNASSSTGVQANQCTAPTFQTVPGTITVSIEYGSQVLQNMQSCLGLSSADLSQQTIDENNNRLGSFSQAGYVGDVNSAMMMGIAAVAVDACNDLATKEASEATTSRRIFPMVDFTQSSISTSAIDDSAIRLARSCWGRDPSSQELQIIETGTANMGAIGAQFQADNVCASVLASLAGVMQ